jgi:hypothetical protein
MTTADQAFNDEVYTAYETALEDQDYGLGEALEYASAKALEAYAKDALNREAFVKVVSAYKGGKIDDNQYKAAIADTLRALIYQGYKGKPSLAVFDHVVGVMVEYLPDTVVLFEDRHKS